MKKLSNEYREIWTGNLVNSDNCPLCSSTKITSKTKRIDNLSIFECSTCGLGFINPKPSIDDILNYYNEDYFTGKKDFHNGTNYLDLSSVRFSAENQTGFREVIDNIDVKNKSILEIGCGTGVLLALCRKYGAKSVKGYDLSPEVIEYGRKHFSLDLVCENFEDVENNADKYDVIIMIDVLEHIYHIHSFFDKLKNVIATNGTLLIISPNWNGFNYSGNGWAGRYKDFEHLQYFSKKSLGYIVKKYGFSNITVDFDGLPFQLKQYEGGGNKLQKIAKNPFVAIWNMVNKIKFGVTNFVKRKKYGHNLVAIISN